MFFPARSDAVLDQIKDRGLYPSIDAPVFSRHGGTFTNSYALSMTATETIYYTMDGSGPREYGTGLVAGTAYADPITLTHSVRVKARARSDGGEWSALTEAWFTRLGGQDALRVSEVMYRPRRPTGTETNGGFSRGDFEYIELQNSSAGMVGLAGLRFDDGIQFDFDHGSIQTLGAGEHVLVVKDLDAFKSRYPNWANLNIAGEFQSDYSFPVPSLSDGGEGVRLVDVLGSNVLSFTYNDGRGWPIAADGVGHSLVPTAQADQSGAILDHGGNWRASAFIDGSPGRADPDPVVDVVINELAAHTDTGLPPPNDSDDWIELHSVSNVTLTDWYLSDDDADLKKWQIPPDSVITAGGWLTFYESTGFHSNRVDGFGLNKAGEQVFLSHLPGTDQDRVADCVRFGGQENGASWGRYPDGADFWYAMALTPTASNRLAAVEPAISQIMYHPRPAGSTEHEYVVIENDTGHAVELWNEAGPWRVSGIGYTLPPNTTIGDGETLTIVAFDPADAVAVSNFLAAHNLLGTLPLLLGPCDGRLSNTGERLALERPQAPDAAGGSVSWVTVDEVIYSSTAPWPDASANGAALHRLDLRHSGNDPLNWTAQPASLSNPEIMVTSPWTGSRMLIPFTHTATAVVDTNKLDGALHYVEFFLNGTSIGQDASAPFKAVIDYTHVATAGAYTVYADVVDDGGRASSVAAIFTADLAARIGLNSPPDGTSVLPPFSTNLAAWVDDRYVVGAVTVAFFSGAETLGVDGSPPHAITLDQTDFPQAGTYPLHAVLTDDFASTTSAVSYLTVELLKALPFVDGFESYVPGDSLNGRDPDGSHPWVAVDAVVTNSPVQTGSHAGALTSQTASATQTFNDRQTDVWTDLHAQPVFGPSVPPEDGSVAFYVGTNGQVVAYDGVNPTQLSHPPLTEGEWVRFTVHSDHTTRTWGLYLNGNPTPIATGLRFFSSAPKSSYSELTVRGAGTSTARVDSITIDTKAPAMNGSNRGMVLIVR